MAKRARDASRGNEADSPATNTPRRVDHTEAAHKLLEEATAERNPTLYDVCRILGHMNAAIVDVQERAERLDGMWGDEDMLPKQMDEVTDLLHSIEHGQISRASQPKAATRKGRKKKSDPNMALGCGGLILLVILGAIAGNVWKTLTAVS